MRRTPRILYAALLGAVFGLAVLAGWTTLAAQIDSDVYDFLFRLDQRPREPAKSVIYGIDERTLRQGGGLAGLRGILANGLERLRPCLPKAVALDIVLADETAAKEENDRLIWALGRLPNVVLASNLTAHGWENPLAQFPRKATGHVHSDPDPYDNVVRQISLEKVAGRERQWALALETFKAMHPEAVIEEDPNGLTIDGVRLPSPREAARPLLVKFRPASAPVPEITFAELAEKNHCAAFFDKAVFVGITAQSAAQDRHSTPLSFGQTMVGVAINANAYETLASRAFLRPAGNLETVGLALAITLAAGAIFYLLSGWMAYASAAALLVTVHALTWLAFRQGVVFPYTTPLVAAWLGTAATASFQYFVTRRQLDKAEADRSRYQQAIHFVAHEMRSPLTAIQGSSELMGRYKLPEEKRAQMAQMIHSESQRLGRLIQTFLDVERLSEGQMELAREPFAMGDVVRASMERAQPLAERKRMTMTLQSLDECTLKGDRELMEYAVYNLLTNAVKYSPVETQVTVSTALSGGTLRLSVRDQGIGMDEKEARKIFTKFYRTKRAEQSGEAGTGIGLSIVEQIVVHHGGRIEVQSSPGAGSCFTMVLPVEDA
ncbi:MAG: CHASE2 domain-containing protein, partial [Bryobacterales bacterium]|nr:CHASE2 domain-containing protein [Bryobacterales bacterium]